MTAVIVLLILVTLSVLVIVTDSDVRADITEAKERHPANWVPEISNVEVRTMFCTGCGQRLHDTALITTDNGVELADADVVAALVYAHGKTCPESVGRVLGI